MPRTLRRTAGIALAVSLAFGAVSCGNPDRGAVPSPAVDEVSPSSDTALVDPAADTPTEDVDIAQLTELTVELTWAQTAESDKDDMCAGIDLLGTDWAAMKLREGGGYDDTLDWDQAAELIAAKCAAR